MILLDTDVVVAHLKGVWFANLGEAAKTLTDQRLALLRLVCQEQPRSRLQTAGMTTCAGSSALQAAVLGGRVSLLQTAVNFGRAAASVD